MVGAPAMVFEGLFGIDRLRGGIEYLDAGLVFGCLAGLLNILAMMDAYTMSELRLASPAEPSSADADANSETTGAVA